jgi:gamma-tubulin complex component 3
MENNDFFETIINSGQELFGESSTNISSNQLSKLLSDSIAFTSAKNNPYNFRLDARVLDPIHGNLGWDVFTIEYRIDDLPIQYLMHSQMMQYLKMFNFLWKIKQLQFMLHQNFEVANNIRKVELHQVQKSWVKNKWTGEKSARFKKIRWVVKSFNTISIIRFQLNNFINALTRHLSFDVIETNYQTNIIGKLYKSINQEPELANINPEFIKQLTTHSDTFESTEVTPQNIKDLTIDELIHIHETYLNTITKSKIFSEVDEGKFTGLTYSSQVFSLLELVFQFIKSSEEYYHLIINYMLVLNIDEQAMDMDHDIVLLERNLNTMFNKIHKEIYQSNFQYQLNQFIKDMRGDFELRDVSKIFS